MLEPNGRCQRHARLGFEHWVHTRSWPKMVGFCDLLGTPYAPVSKIPSVKSFSDLLPKLRNQLTKNANFWHQSLFSMSKINLKAFFLIFFSCKNIILGTFFGNFDLKGHFWSVTKVVLGLDVRPKIPILKGLYLLCTLGETRERWKSIWASFSQRNSWRQHITFRTF